MPRWIFRLIIVLFLLALAWTGYDITRRTTFPGSKGQLGERIRKQWASPSGNAPVDSSAVLNP